jgi:hypothetical protein
MKNDKPEWLIPKSKYETEEDVWLYDIDIEILHLESKGFEQPDIVKWTGKQKKCIKNHVESINEKTGCCNPQGRVGWALNNGVLFSNQNRVIVIALEYTKTESENEKE